jgi:hypothetical protein
MEAQPLPSWEGAGEESVEAERDIGDPAFVMSMELGRAEGSAGIDLRIFLCRRFFLYPRGQSAIAFLRASAGTWCATLSSITSPEGPLSWASSVVPFPHPEKKTEKMSTKASSNAVFLIDVFIFSSNLSLKLISTPILPVKQIRQE